MRAGPRPTPCGGPMAQRSCLGTPDPPSCLLPPHRHPALERRPALRKLAIFQGRKVELRARATLVGGGVAASSPRGEDFSRPCTPSAGCGLEDSSTASGLRTGAIKSSPRNYHVRGGSFASLRLPPRRRSLPRCARNAPSERGRAASLAAGV